MAKKKTVSGAKKIQPEAEKKVKTITIEKKLSLLNAAFEVLKESEEAMTVKTMITKAKEKNLWAPGNGKTPEQTLYSAIMREMKRAGEASRFVKDPARGFFRARP